MWTLAQTWAPVVRDVLSLGIAALGAYLAHLAIKLGRQQAKVAETQKAIAERQHQLLEESLAKRPDLRVRAEGQNRDGLEPESDTIVRLIVTNGGTRKADGCNWEVIVRFEEQFLFKFIDQDGAQVRLKFMPMSEQAQYERVDGHITHSIFPGTGMDIIRMKVPVTGRATEHFTIFWRIKYEEGLMPARGFGQISFRREGDSFFSVRHHDPLEDVHLPLLQRQAVDT